MDKIDYVSKINDLTFKFNSDKRQIMLKYAQSNSNVKVGDYVTDHIGSIKVEVISIDTFECEPKLRFYGPEYTKKLTPFKSGSSRMVYQVNIKHIYEASQ